MTSVKKIRPRRMTSAAGENDYSDADGSAADAGDIYYFNKHTPPPAIGRHSL
jgi:hypothetical protein